MIPSGASTASSESLSPLPSSGPSGQVSPPSQGPSSQQGSGKQSAKASQTKNSQRLARTGEKAGLGFGLALLLFALVGLGLKAKRPEED